MANVNILAKKQGIIDEIAERVTNANSVVFFEYRGLSVSEMTELRRKLRETDSDVKIYKNTLAKRALDTLNYDLTEELNGPKAMAYGSDTIAPIKVLSEFAKGHPALEIKVGIVDGEITQIDTLKQLATLPSREQLLTMLAGGLMGTVRDLSICLDLYSQDLENK
ncbi:MAG: 50S ribosomal protein L10 [Firmicutes bacterium]|nr:50S ribosomal protein L10 [Bacillota bacterium]